MVSQEVGEILRRVLEKVRPAEEERARALRIYEDIKNLIEESLNIPHDFKVELHGSVAKGTELRGDMDLDIFILIRYDEMSREWLENHVVRPLCEVFKEVYGSVKLKYAAHPYLYIDLERYKVDVVPAYWARDVSEVRTAVDRTPFHTRYVLSKLTEEAKDEARLLKAFFKGIGIYGAEIKVEGFSGYLTELLIVKYGTFLETVKAMSSWRIGEVIVVDRETVKEGYGYLRRVFKSPLIVPDPVDPRRNAASAVSAESLGKAVLSSHLFLLKPSESFFSTTTGIATIDAEVIRNSIEAIKSTDREAVGVVFKISESSSPDILWGKLRSAARSLINYLRRVGFNVISYTIWSDEVSEAVILITLTPRSLTEYEVHQGPPLGKVDNLRAFISKYHAVQGSIGPYVDIDGRVFAFRRRKKVLPHQFLEERAIASKEDSFLRAFRILKNLEEVRNYVETRGCPDLVEALRRIALLELI